MPEAERLRTYLRRVTNELQASRQPAGRRGGLPEYACRGVV
ncbi:MAG: hypothetical protein QOF52_3364 [Propionibacteriaceae bacterium]|jgi:hypothetical protein|nr:hypothetical protein [Propionibacteriaceae bacterium]